MPIQRAASESQSAARDPVAERDFAIVALIVATDTKRGESFREYDANIKSPTRGVIMSATVAKQSRIETDFVRIAHGFGIQPIIDLSRDVICGGEVLWRPSGQPPTALHLRLLETESELNHEVTRRSLSFALDSLERLPSNIWLSINLSTKFLGCGTTLLSPLNSIIPDFASRCRQAGKRLVFEITERSIGGAIESNFINQLSNQHTIAVDDFGISDAPLSHMLSLNFSKVKLDHRLISGIESDLFRQRFIRWLVSGCHAVGARVCAEGVETIDQLATLKKLGVDEGQGWLWSRSVPAHIFASYAEYPYEDSETY